MYYSCVDFFIIIIHLIINRQAFDKRSIEDSADEAWKKEATCYRRFILMSTCFYIIDLFWGVLYDLHKVSGLFPIIYSCTILFFLFMFLTMQTWIHYIVAYLNKRHRRSKVLLYFAWAMFALGIVVLMVNRFHPFIFSFNDDHEYLAESGRYTVFLFQIVVHMITSVYMIHIARKSIGDEKNRYFAVGLSALSMGVFQILQIFDPMFPLYAMGLLVGTCVNHSFVQAGEKKAKERYDNIARSLAEDYEAIYYINSETGEYREYSTSSEYDSMNVPMVGKDFFTETQANAERYAHPDDRDFAKSNYIKDIMIRNLEDRKSYSYKYRIMVGGQSRYFRFTVIRADENHIVLCEKDIDDEVTAESMRLESQKNTVTFTRIAESLASNYDLIYYVELSTDNYITYESNDIYGLLQIRHTSVDFFGECVNNIDKIIHKPDRDKVLEFLDKDHLLSTLESHKMPGIDYRMLVNGKPVYHRMSVRKTSDGTHIIIGVENVDEEIRKEKEVLKALSNEKELARRDELTGLKNKTAYIELEKSVESNIENGMDYLPFALVVCDANDLKKINDTQGHAAGDEYLKDSAKLLCGIFTHSPVFRIGGDEFAVFLRGDDYTNRDELMGKLKKRVLGNKSAGFGPVIASGMAEYDKDKDVEFSDVFERADSRMYEDKQKLKGKA